MEASFFLSPPCGMGASARCEGRCPSGAGRETWLLLPEVEGLRPHAPIGRALRPIPREFLCRAGSPCTHQWAYPAHTRGSFRFTTKGTKGVPGLRPWTPSA